MKIGDVLFSLPADSFSARALLAAPHLTDRACSITQIAVAILSIPAVPLLLVADCLRHTYLWLRHCCKKESFSIYLRALISQVAVAALFPLHLLAHLFGLSNPLHLVRDSERTSASKLLTLLKSPKLDQVQVKRVFQTAPSSELTALLRCLVEDQTLFHKLLEIIQVNQWNDCIDEMREDSETILQLTRMLPLNDTVWRAHLQIVSPILVS